MHDECKDRGPFIRASRRGHPKSIVLASSRSSRDTGPSSVLPKRTIIASLPARPRPVGCGYICATSARTPGPRRRLVPYLINHGKPLSAKDNTIKATVEESGQTTEVKLTVEKDHMMGLLAQPPSRRVKRRVAQGGRIDALVDFDDAATGDRASRVGGATCVALL